MPQTYPLVLHAFKVDIVKESEVCELYCKLFIVNPMIDIITQAKTSMQGHMDFENN